MLYLKCLNARTDPFFQGPVLVPGGLLVRGVGLEEYSRGLNSEEASRVRGIGQ